MKIALLVPTFNYYSGVDRVAQDIAEKRSKEGHKVTVFASEAEIKPKGYNIHKIGSLKNFSREYKRILPFYYTKEKYVKMLKGFDEVISLIYPMDALAYKAKKKYGLKYTAWFSGIAPGENRIESMYMRIYKQFYYHYLKNADKIICVSNFVKYKLAKETDIPIEHMITKYNNIDRKRFNLNVTNTYKNKIKELINKYNLENKKVFLYVGRLATSKRVDKLIKIYQRNKEEYADSKLIIVGKPTFKSNFNKLLSIADEDIIFTGFVDDRDLPAFYALSDVFVTASHDEGFNLPAVEAQACGKPVVAFKIGSHEEVIKKGKLVEDGDMEGFADAMFKYAKLT